MFEKTPYEELFRTRDFSPWLESAETISSASVIVTEKNSGADATATMAPSNQVAPHGTPARQVRYKIIGGTAGKTYRIGVRVVTTNGQKLESYIDMKVNR